ncbi:MAG TPA: hypothetical protein VMH41_14750 [Mycobacteriales bacterium]|nr:hypothetical protein [Mycobacteriales bacterium]
MRPDREGGGRLIRRTIVGFEVQEADRGGRRYTYPMDYPNLERIEASIELAASHDDGDVEGLKVDPQRYPAQDAYFSTGVAQSPSFVRAMAGLVDPRFGALFDRVLSDEGNVASLRAMGDHLAAGGNIVNAVPHGPLLDIGLMHALPYLALADLGYDLRIGIVISHGVAGRGRRFNDELVCLADALDWACDKVWYVTPQTRKTRESSYTEVASRVHIHQRNAVVRADIGSELDRGGMLLTVAPSATSNRTDSAGVTWLESPTAGTMRLLAHPRTLVGIAGGRMLGMAEPGYSLGPELIAVSPDDGLLDAQTRLLVQRLAEVMAVVDPAGSYAARRR